MSRVRRHHGAIWWVGAVGAAIAAAWWLFAGSGTAWYWRGGPALVWLAVLVAAGAATAAAAGRGNRRDALTRAIVASAPDAVVVVDEDGGVVELNPAAERMFGRSRDAAVGRPVVGGMLSVDTAWEREGRHEVTARRADGETFPAEVSAAPVVGLAERLHVLHVRDLGERRRAERAVSDLAAIVQSSDDGILSLSPEGLIESWNAGAERLYGYTPAEATGRPISIVEPRGRYRHPDGRVSAPRRRVGSAHAAPEGPGAGGRRGGRRPDRAGACRHRGPVPAPAARVRERVRAHGCVVGSARARRPRGRAAGRGEYKGSDPGYSVSPMATRPGCAARASSGMMTES